LRLLLITAIAGGSLWAQSDGTIQGPVLGLFFDRQASAVRLLEGIPGAARMGTALYTDFLEGAVAGNGQYAVAIERGGTAALVFGAGRRSLPGARVGATGVIVSPRGTAAALLFRDPSEIQVFVGLPEAPRLLRSVDPAGAPASVALSDDGEIVLSLMRSVRGEDVVYAHAGGGPLVFYRARRVAALSFVPGTHDALVAEPASVKIVRPDLGEQPAGSDPDRDIAAVAASPDGSRLFIAGRSGRVTIHDTRTGTTASVQCACSPRMLAPLRGDSVFRLTDGADGPVWLLDADSPQPRISFVAAGESR
jgi:hypothetical protein